VYDKDFGMDDLAQNLAPIFRLRSEEITDTLTMADVPTWDSLSHIELVVTLEQVYGVTLSGDDIAEMTSVAAIRRVLAQALAGE
jgi:acyl carrier protein